MEYNLNTSNRECSSREISTENANLIDDLKERLYSGEISKLEFDDMNPNTGKSGR